MTNLINSNIYRLLKSKEFLILLILYPSLTILTQITRMFNFVEISNAATMYISGLNNWFVITLASLIISNFISEDFMLGSIFYRIGKGYKKSTIYLSYIITSTIIMMCFILLQAIIGFIIGLTLSDIGTININLAYMTFFAIICSIVYSSLFTMVAIFTRKTYQAMTINAIISIVLTAIIPYANSFISNRVITVLFPSSYIFKINTLDASSTIIFIAVMIAYILAFYFIGLHNFNKRDIE